MDGLEQILSSLSYLNLEGQIIDKKAHASGFGGSCDVYSAWSSKHNKKVAVKQIRAFMTKDKDFAKVIRLRMKGGKALSDSSGLAAISAS